MRILVTGSSGLIGSALTPRLDQQGDTTVRLGRDAAAGDGMWWDPEAGVIDLSGAGGIDAVVHLAGENLVGRWTEEKKRRIRDSRVGGTRLLCRALAALPGRPQVLVAASAVGYYGDRGDEEVGEESPPGTGFLAEVCREWEAATQPAGEAGVRVVLLRLGIVLTPTGGALARMLGAFKAGLGGPMGGGHHWLSWVTLEDVLGAVRHALTHDDLSGPVNVVAPNPVTQAEFARTLAKVLHRPALVHTPAFVLRILLGREMVDEMLLASTRVRPQRLMESGFTFEYTELETALRALLGREG